jgi:hypothetical protein
MRLVGYASCMGGDEECIQNSKFKSENLKGRDHLGDLSVDGRLKLNRF